MTEEVIEKALDGTWYCFKCKQPVTLTVEHEESNEKGFRATILQASCPLKHNVKLYFEDENLTYVTKDQLKKLATAYMHAQLDDLSKNGQDIFIDHLISGMMSLTGLNNEECKRIITQAMNDGSVTRTQKSVSILEKVGKGKKDVFIQQVELDEEE